MSADRTTVLWLWVGLAAAPLAWLVQLAGGYAVADFGCERGGGAGEVAGVSPDAFALGLTVVALVLAGVGIVAAAATWRRTDPSHLSFLGLAGLLAGGLFIALIALSGAGVLVLDTCETS